MSWPLRAQTWYARQPAQRQVLIALVLGLGGSNVIGILVVLALLTLVVPMPEVDRQRLAHPENVTLAMSYLVIAASLGMVTAWRLLHPVMALLDDGHRPSADDQRAVLAAPRLIFWRQAVLWGIAAVLFAVINALASPDLGLSVLLIIGLAGWTTSCLAYLVAERSLRPVARRVMVRGFPTRRSIRSVADRTMFAWGLGTGVAAIGTVLVGVIALTDLEHTTAEQLAVTTVVMGLLTLTFGFLSSYVAAQASSEPIRNLGEAVADVEQGSFEVEVPIYDGTEIGTLQAGFNRMIRGLREREELRDLFGRHVGSDVARAALEGGVRLGGEVRDVAVLFVDIIGSTSLAHDRPPDEVVEVLNRFFHVVIDVVHQHDGWINKFEGDAALAVWGAPVDLAGKETAALRAARVMGERLAAEVPEIEAGIGVAFGPAVAGNVGAAARYEYTVIGDPVNVAARLTGEAKLAHRRVVASGRLVALADEGEARHWRELPPITVRGRPRPTQIATPR